jgi:Domain of unknown function (DUF4347)/FG-GAP repeat
MLNTQNHTLSSINSRSITKTSATTLVVFDDRVSDLEILYQALLPGSIGFTISSQDDGLEEITRLLEETEVEFLSIVAHGESGIIHLGRNPVNIQQLQAKSQLLQNWGVKEIALYSCEVAKDDVGKHFIHQLSELTGATVAAAFTKIGAATLGGNWDLAVTTSNVLAPTLFEASILQNYPSVLISVSLVAGTTPIEGGILGTFEVSLDAPAPAGGIIVNFTTTGTTATPNLDYALSIGTGITAITTNTFTIAAGVTKATINVIAFRDAVIDPNEIITINTTAGTGDFNGDGKADILWRNDNGAAAIWGMNGAAVVSADIVATIANSWSVVAPVL